MVFTTGKNEEYTVWVMTEFTRNPYFVRYARVTPNSRWGFVDVRCEAVSEYLTSATVRYYIQAFDSAEEGVLKDFEAQAFTGMITEWKTRIDSHLDILKTSLIR